MKFSLCFISLININILPKTYSHGLRKVPGNASCGYFSALKETCGVPSVNASELPKEATSIFYSGVATDANLDVRFGFENRSNDENIKSMISTGKQVFLFYFHDGDDQLLDKIFNNTEDGGQYAKMEMVNLKKFIEPYKDIAGFSVCGLLYPTNETTLPYLTENFKIYIDVMREFFPNYGIGLSIEGNNLINLFVEADSPVWFDMRILDSCFDFYVVEIYSVFLCSNPIDGADYSMQKVVSALSKLGIPKGKTHFVFSAAYGKPVEENQSKCDITNANGGFAYRYGSGFITNDVDLDDDPHGSCQCNPYPGFHAILAGFNGGPLPPVCPLLEGQ